MKNFPFEIFDAEPLPPVPVGLVGEKAIKHDHAAWADVCHGDGSNEVVNLSTIRAAALLGHPAAIDMMLAAAILTEDSRDPVDLSGL